MKKITSIRICIGVVIVISILAIMIHPRVFAIGNFCDQNFDQGPTLGETMGKEMQSAYKRSEEFLDLDLIMTETKQDAKDNIINNVIQNATPADLANMQKLLQI